MTSRHSHSRGGIIPHGAFPNPNLPYLDVHIALASICLALTGIAKAENDGQPFRHGGVASFVSDDSST